MGIDRTGNVDTSGGLSAELAVPRPQSRDEWVRWYATKHAARAGLANRGAADLADVYGLDADSIADQVERWNGPHLPDGLFTAWFGTCTRPRPAPQTRIRLSIPPSAAADTPAATPAATPAKPRRPASATDSGVDEVLVERAVAGKVPLSKLNAGERVAAVGQMFTAGHSLSTIAKRLGMNGVVTAKLVGAWRASQGEVAA
jgi:hypothetical protein